MPRIATRFSHALLRAADGDARRPLTGLEMAAHDARLLAEKVGESPRPGHRDRGRAGELLLSVCRRQTGRRSTRLSQLQLAHRRSSRRRSNPERR